MNPTRVIRAAALPEPAPAYAAPGEAHVAPPGTAIGYAAEPAHGHTGWICKDNLPSNQFNGPDCEKSAAVIKSDAEAAAPGKGDKEGGAKSLAQVVGPDFSDLKYPVLDATVKPKEPYKWPVPAYKPPGEAHVEPPGAAIGYERAPASGSIGWNCDNEFPQYDITHANCDVRPSTRPGKAAKAFA